MYAVVVKLILEPYRLLHDLIFLMEIFLTFSPVLDHHLAA